MSKLPVISGRKCIEVGEMGPGRTRSKRILRPLSAPHARLRPRAPGVGSPIRIFPPGETTGTIPGSSKLRLRCTRRRGFTSQAIHYGVDMFCEYIQAAMSKAIYEVIGDEQPYYGEVPELKGVWATGKTAEECRENLRMAIEDWIALSLICDLPIPPIEGHKIEAPEAPVEA